MSNRFTRRQNTNGWWQVEINGIIDRGEQLKDRARGTIRFFDDLKTYKDEIDRWLSDAKSQIRTIYHDSSVAEEYCRPVGHVDLEGSSWSNIIDSLKAVIDQRIAGLRNLVGGKRR